MSSIIGSNIFAYSYNSPNRWIDLEGKKPGDLFDSVEEAAHDFAMFINVRSISERTEYISAIYRVSIGFMDPTPVIYANSNLYPGFATSDYSKATKYTIKHYYTYTVPNPGSYSGATLVKHPRKVANIHSHANYAPGYLSDQFSDDDKSHTGAFPIYVCTPKGELWKYDPVTKEEILLFTDIPFDAHHPDRINDEGGIIY